ncbi:Polysaccharide monooxygenase Cel61a [Paramyrothecium foliicola]|nr:Polysaccharide monooxygenase Cel61a [Paramyrothecium foliicola]
MAFSALFLALIGAASVSAHGYVDSIEADGQVYTGYNPTIAPWQAVQDSPGWQNWATDLGYVPSDGSSLNSADIICHRSSVNAPKVVTVAAGNEVKLRWNGWPADSHKGPIMDYLARCNNNDCITVDKTSLQFFKIAQLGQISFGSGNGAAGRWAPDVLVENGFTWKVKIPASLAPGSYVLRHEILALHSAYNEGGGQFYPQCINLRVTGSGTTNPSGTPGTQLYNSKDAGIIYNVYNDESKPTYRIPGPALCELFHILQLP